MASSIEGSTIAKTRQARWNGDKAVIWLHKQSLNGQKDEVSLRALFTILLHKQLVLGSQDGLFFLSQ